MRRYDAGYRLLKQVVDSDIGAPLMVHAAHRNPTVPEQYVTPMAIHDTLIHEIDVFRWLLDDDYVSAQVVFPRASSHSHSKLKDPQVVLLETAKGIRIDVEVFVNCRYGYDIQCQVVGEDGIASLPEPMAIVMRKEAKLQNAILTDWKDRFIASYDVELAGLPRRRRPRHRLRPDLLGRLRRRHLLGRLRRGAGGAGHHRPDLPAGASGAL